MSPVDLRKRIARGHRQLIHRNAWKGKSRKFGHRKRQIEEKLQLGTLWRENGLVFPSQVGTPIGGRNLIRHFKIRLGRAGLTSTFRFHDLRHACATLLLRQGVHVKFVQELLGHCDVSLTLNTYSHVLPDMGDADAMDKALG